MFRWRSIKLVIPLLALSNDDEGTPRFAVREALTAKEHADTSQRQYLTDHIHFIHHQRKQILLLDLSNCSPAEVRKIFQAVPEFVTVRPQASVLILADFTGASFDAEAIRVMEQAAVFDKPHVRKCAWTGTAQALAMIVSNFSCREFPVFQTRKEALAWLAKD
jgi:mannose/fructose-specific phosphotransferase system component IIA